MPLSSIVSKSIMCRKSERLHVILSLNKLGLINYNTTETDLSAYWLRYINAK